MRRVLLFFIVLLWFGGAQAASLKAQVDRRELFEDQTLVLKLTGRDVKGEPDLSGLDKDFDVLSQSRSTQTRMSSQGVDSSTVWSYVLAPKHSGPIQIPVLSIDDAKSRVIKVLVKARSKQGKDAADRDFFIELDVSNTQPYVQAQVLYKVKVFMGKDLMEGSLSEPSDSRLISERVGRDQDYTDTRGGRSYKVIERTFALYPQASGRLELPPVTLSGKVPEVGTQRGFFTTAKPVRVRSENVVLNVRSKPDDYGSGWWLPAEEVTLKEHWQGDVDSVQVGEPINRIITLAAKGLTAAQLPPIPQPTLDGLKIYPDQPQLETNPVFESIIASREEKWAIIPAKPGKLRLPAVKLTWWDTVNQVKKVAEIPERVITVVGNASTAPTVKPEVGSTPPAEVTREKPPANEAVTTPVLAPQGATGVSTVWPWLALIGFGGWFVTGLLWWRSRGAPTLQGPKRHITSPQSFKRIASMKQLKAACGNGNPKDVKEALMAWSAVQWPEQPPVNLMEIAARVGSSALQQRLQGLDFALYAGNSVTADVTDLDVMLKRELTVTDKKPSEATALPEW